MDEKKSIKVTLGTTICIIIIVLLIIALGIVYYLGFVKNNTEITQLAEEKQTLQKQVTSLEENKNLAEKEVTASSTMSNEEASKIVQDTYSKAYSIIQEGTGLTGTNTVNITAGQEGTVGGVINVTAHKLDFSKIEPYFTERAINYIKTEFTDTPYGHKDGNYYIYTSENIYSYDKKEFINTIFGVTDQGLRNFQVKLFDDDMIVAVSEKSSFFKLDEYIILKKVNNSWKIDMFEEL